MSGEESAVAALARSLEERGFAGAEIAVVAGSGLGVIAERLERAISVPFAELDLMPRSSVAGHAGRFAAGDLAGVRLLVQCGRVHLYEGWSPHEVVRSVRAIARLGCRAIVLTNAAGSLRGGGKLPRLMRITDHMNLQGASPLAAPDARSVSPYDEPLGLALDRGAREAGIELEGGVYAGVLGPSYETPAEVRWLASIGASAVGMSTVLEALAAHAAGMRVAAISCLANAAAGLSSRPPSHGEVLEAGAAAARELAKLLEASMPRVRAAAGRS